MQDTSTVTSNMKHSNSNDYYLLREPRPGMVRKKQADTAPANSEILTGSVQQARILTMKLPTPTVRWLIRDVGRGHWNAGAIGMPATSTAVYIEKFVIAQPGPTYGVKAATVRFFLIKVCHMIQEIVPNIAVATFRI